ncbi:MAG TPA: glycosyltransferase [Anaerolinea sp.]|nr:glycosyltransferase [Anaerolinea sp.]
MNKFSLLVCAIKYPPETFLQRLIFGLAEQGIDITLATDQKPASAWLSGHSISWLWAPGWNVPYMERAINSIRLARYLPSWGWKKIRYLANIGKQGNFRNRFRGWYQHLPYGKADWNAVYFPWVLAADEYMDWFTHQGVPVVVSLRGSMVNVDPHVPPKKDMVRSSLQRVFSRAAAVHCVSQDILDEAVQYGLDPHKAVVIRPAVDPGFFTPPAERSNNPRFTILNTGSLVWVKGYEYALSSIRLLVDSGVDAEFHIIGDGPERQRILYTIQDLGLEDRVALLGKLPPTQVRDHLQQADVFMLSSLSEGISNAVLEAMACGLPVVTTDCGGMREAVTDGVEGFVVPVRDPDAMANALLKLALNPSLREQMGTAGRDRVLKDFYLSDQISDFSSFFYGCVDS